MKTTENNYKVSKNYNLLHDLIVNEGLQLICFVNHFKSYFTDSDTINKNIVREVGTIEVVNNLKYEIKLANIAYERAIYNNLKDIDRFNEICIELDLSFIKPTKGESK